ncbi:TPA: hypothetical protein NKQ46_003742 [Vibrio parahaemolyticus]|nr:hypothetical protein [Vibrio parahaemolyticus]
MNDLTKGVLIGILVPTILGATSAISDGWLISALGGVTKNNIDNVVTGKTYSAEHISSGFKQEDLGSTFPAVQESSCKENQVVVAVRVYKTVHDACNNCTGGVQVICSDINLK